MKSERDPCAAADLRARELDEGEPVVRPGGQSVHWVAHREGESQVESSLEEVHRCEEPETP